MTEDIGHQAAEPREYTRLSFQYSTSDAIEALGLMKPFEHNPLISCHVLSYSFFCTCCSCCLECSSLPAFPLGFSSGWQHLGLGSGFGDIMKVWVNFSIFATRSCVTLHESSALVMMKFLVYASEFSHYRYSQHEYTSASLVFLCLILRLWCLAHNRYK